MLHKQQSIKQDVSLSGKGLHTGIDVTMTLKPAAANHGIKFKRVDLEGQPIIDADVDNVIDTSRGTTLEQNGAQIATCEHLLSAIVSSEIDNILIEIDNIELHILDGSALFYL